MSLKATKTLVRNHVAVVILDTRNVKNQVKIPVRIKIRRKRANKCFIYEYDGDYDQVFTHALMYLSIINSTINNIYIPYYNIIS